MVRLFTVGSGAEIGRIYLSGARFALLFYVVYEFGTVYCLALAIKPDYEEKRRPFETFFVFAARPD